MEAGAGGTIRDQRGPESLYTAGEGAAGRHMAAADSRRRRAPEIIFMCIDIYIDIHQYTKVADSEGCS